MDTPTLKKGTATISAAKANVAHMGHMGRMGRMGHMGTTQANPVSPPGRSPWKAIASTESNAEATRTDTGLASSKR